VTLTSESCLVCHNASDVASVATMHDFTFDTTNNINTRSKPRLNEKNFVVAVSKVEATAANLPKITFNVKLSGVNYTTLTSNYLSRIVIADLVPAPTVGTTTYVSSYFEAWAYESGVVSIPANNVNLVASSFDASDAANGNYSITLPNAFGVASTFKLNAAASANVAKNTNYNAAHSQRLFLRVGAPGLLSTTVPGGATQTVLTSLYGVGNGIAAYDFTVPAAGATAAKLDNKNMFVTIEACYKCHGPQLAATGHGSGYRDTLGCVVCHSPLFGDSRWNALTNLPAFSKTQAGLMHAIHNANAGTDFAEVTYPQDIGNCVACHTTSGRVLGTGDKIDNWKNNPSVEGCAGCHVKNKNGVTINWTTGAGHEGGTSLLCSLCHPATGTGFGKSVTEAHAVTPAAKDVPEYTATMTITAPANGTHYVIGESPTVTVTLKDKATGTAVPGAVYTAAKHTAGSFVAGSLSKAALYVYGPRANAKPALTKGAVTLSATGVPTQSNSLLLPATDTQVTTSAAGFSYKLSPITATTASGTYMVRFIAANYGYVADTNYKLDSTAFTTIKVGANAVEAMISGSACTDCHSGLLEIHNARHSVSFTANTTDECISCHDKSGNHAQPLDRRVHAIHSASKTGDLVAGATAPLDWSEVTYPQGLPTVNATTGVTTATGAPRCITCHTGTSGTGLLWKTTSVSQRSCIGCHADKPGADDHMLQNGGK
jgi:OmcA/MtrC family decaheme c-type cytochrome